MRLAMTRTTGQRTAHERAALYLQHNGIESHWNTGALMNSIIYIIGLIVVILAILSFFGLR
jgi:hypothetical protein